MVRWIAGIFCSSNPSLYTNELLIVIKHTHASSYKKRRKILLKTITAGSVEIHSAVCVCVCVALAVSNELIALSKAINVSKLCF